MRTAANAAQLAFAREHQDWQRRHWRRVLFTDENTEHNVTDVTETGDALENVTLPATSSGMTGLPVGQQWFGGGAFLWKASQLSWC